jgi:hypothetical protein
VQRAVHCWFHVSLYRSLRERCPVGRVMAQAVSRWTPTAEARVRSRVSPCGICGGQSGTGTGFSPSTSSFPCQLHSTGAPLHGKTKTKTLIIIITGLHNKPQGCGASVASAAGPFTTKKKCPVLGYKRSMSQLRLSSLWNRPRADVF